MKRFFLCVLAVLSFFACQKMDEMSWIEFDSGEDVELALPAGGYISVRFSVSGDLSGFVSDINSSECGIRLETESGQKPDKCFLKSVTREAPGRYIASIEDSFSGEGYESVLVLVIEKDGRECRSGKVSVRCTGLTDVKAPATGLPVVYIQTRGGAVINSKEEYLDALIHIDGNGDFDDVPLTMCQIRGRGSSTWQYPKKPYLIKFDKKTEVLGMPKHKRWVLLANFIDKTLMRNAIAYKISTHTSLAYTTRGHFCEVVLNGKHIGNYDLREQIKVDKNRLNISEDGGYLFEFDGHYTNEVKWMDPHGKAGLSKFDGQGIPCSIKYPDEDEITSGQIQYGKDYIYEVAEALYGSDFKDPVKGYRKYLDVQSYVDYWIVFELMVNHELGGPLSVYMHKDAEGLLTAGPVWDFDWGSLSFFNNPSARDKMFLKNAIWYAQLFKDPYFTNMLKERWTAMYPELLTDIPLYIESCRTLLRPSAGYNFKLWNPADDKSSNGGKLINGDENMSFDDAVDLLKANYLQHLSTMNSEIGAM